MLRKALLTLSVSLTLTTTSLAPTAALAQFPPGPPPIGAGGPPPIPAGGPPAFAGAASAGPGGVPRADLRAPAPRPSAGAGPRGDLNALGRAGAERRGGAELARSVRSASVGYSRSGRGERSGYRTYAAGAYAAGAFAGYVYGRSGYGNSDGDCYYLSRRYRRILVCD